MTVHTSFAPTAFGLAIQTPSVVYIVRFAFVLPLHASNARTFIFYTIHPSLIVFFCLLLTSSTNNHVPPIVSVRVVAPILQHAIIANFDAPVATTDVPVPNVALTKLALTVHANLQHIRSISIILSKLFRFVSIDYASWNFSFSWSDRTAFVFPYHPRLPKQR
jgi:hypothetical protein